MIKPNKKFKNSAGITLIEGLVVIAILGLILTASIVDTKAKKDKVMFKESEAIVLRAFEKARNRAETGFGIGNHGTRIDGTTITIFENDCESDCEDDINISLNSVNLNPSSLEVVFERITAQTGSDTSVILSNSNGLSSVINILSDGTIIIN